MVGEGVGWREEGIAGEISLQGRRGKGGEFELEGEKRGIGK